MICLNRKINWTFENPENSYFCLLIQNIPRFRWVVFDMCIMGCQCAKCTTLLASHEFFERFAVKCDGNRTRWKCEVRRKSGRLKLDT